MEKFAHVSKVRNWLEIEIVRLNEILKLIRPVLKDPFMFDDRNQERIKEKVIVIWKGTFFQRGIRVITREEYLSFKPLLAALKK